MVKMDFQAHQSIENWTENTFRVIQLQSHTYIPSKLLQVKLFNWNKIERKSVLIEICYAY